MASPLTRLTLEGNADCVEFCPYFPFQDILACATYTLDESCQRRTGHLYLFRVSENGGSLSPACQLPVPGIFDCKWFPVEEEGKFVGISLACSNGSIYVYTFSASVNKPLDRREAIEEGDDQGRGGEDDGECVLDALDEVKCDEEAMCLSLDWNECGSTSSTIGQKRSSSQSAVCSLSDGSLCTLRWEETRLSLERKWKGHQFEAWVTSHDRWKRDVVYSGADDCHFCAWDLRTDLHRPIFRDKKTHTMGVCSIQGSHLQEHLVCTGSYDEVLRLWDVRNPSLPIMHSPPMSLGGGIWRLKWHPSDETLLLAACMHNGFCIVSMNDPSSIQEDENNKALCIMEEYKHHTSLAYGADWRSYPLRSEVASDTSSDADGDSLKRLHHSRSLVATCSFYDRLVHTWSPSTIACWKK